MKKLATISLLIISLLSCNKSKDLEGTWIEIDNFNNPAVMKYWDGKFYQYDGIYQDTVNYRILGNKIIYEKHGKASYKLENDTLAFTFDTVTYPFRLEKFTFDKYYEYLFNKLNVSINLPKGNGKKITYRSFNNFITLSKRNDSTLFSFNGKFYDLASFTLEYNDFEWDHKLNLLFIDSLVTMNDVDKLEQVLMELNLPRIAYITNSSNLKGITIVRGFQVYLPNDSDNYTRLTYKNGLRPLKVPPPPEIFNINKKNRIVFEFNNKSILVDGIEMNYEDLQIAIEKSIVNDKKFCVLYYINDSCQYSDFIGILKDMNKPYAKVRDSLAIVNYGTNYLNLDSEKQREIRKLYPKRIIKLTNEELQLIKNNP